MSECIHGIMENDKVNLFQHFCIRLLILGLIFVKRNLEQKIHVCFQQRRIYPRMIITVITNKKFTCSKPYVKKNQFSVSFRKLQKYNF